MLEAGTCDREGLRRLARGDCDRLAEFRGRQETLGLRQRDRHGQGGGRRAGARQRVGDAVFPEDRGRFVGGDADRRRCRCRPGYRDRVGLGGGVLSGYRDDNLVVPDYQRGYCDAIGEVGIGDGGAVEGDGGYFRGVVVDRRRQGDRGDDIADFRLIGVGI